MPQNFPTNVVGTEKKKKRICRTELPCPDSRGHKFPEAPKPRLSSQKIDGHRTHLPPQDPTVQIQRISQDRS